MIEKMYNKKIIIAFIVLQPLLDVITYFFNCKFNFSIGIIVRGLFLIYSLAYLMFFDKKNLKNNLKYIAAIIIFTIVFFLLNCKNLSIFIFKINSLLKYFYFPILTLFFYRYQADVEEKLVTNGFMISMLMLLSQLIGGTILSYESAKLGNSGWFFSANELSSICSILIPIIYSYFIKNFNKYGLLTFILLSISMLLIGTKTAYLSIGITLFSFIFYYLCNILIKKKNYKKQIIVTVLALLIFILVTPFTYAYKNISIQENVSGDSSLSGIVLNGRDNILNENLNNVKFNFLTGIELKSKTNYEFERDYYNIYYNYGVLGFIVFLIVPVCIILSNMKNIKKIFSDVGKYGSFIGVLLGLSIAYISGHTLLSPAVSIYISVLFVNILKKEQTKEKKVMFISSVGGHLTQLLELKKIFNDYKYVLVTEKTEVTKGMKNKYNMNYLLYGSRKYIIKYIFIAIANCIKSIYIFVKYNPDVIVTTGTHTAVPMCYIGWFLNRKIIYIESFAKRTSPTMAGKIIYPVATTFVVQWKSMLKFYPKAEYWGGIY